MAGSKQQKSDRSAIYIDVFCGITSAIIALTGLTIAVITNRVASMGWFAFNVTFWICWLGLSVFLISLGIYTWYKEKHFDKYKPRDDLKAPVV
ncbi:MAG: hypothetical protein ACFFDF_04500 [Candidatus Odinarchaeota archaeon]